MILISQIHQNVSIVQYKIVINDPPKILPKIRSPNQEEYSYQIHLNIAQLLRSTKTIICIQMPKRRLSPCIPLFLLLIASATSHIVKQVANEQKQIITAFLNQANDVSIPFQKCFKVQTELQANQKYVQFQPTRVTLNAQKSYSLKNQGSKISVLEELRSPISYKHRHLLVFEGYLMVFFAPNVIIVVEQTSNGFIVKNRYYLENLDRFDQFKMYKLGKRGLLVVYNKKKAYLLNQIDYEDYTLPDISTIIHLNPINEQEFYAAEFMKGLTHYRLNHKDKTIDVVERYSGESVGMPTTFRYIVDLSLSFHQDDKIILVLDAQVGLIQFYPEKRSAKIVVPHIMCESFDTVERNHIVLLCQNQGHSTILQAYRYFNKQTKQYTYRKVEPIFQTNYLNDLHVTDSYFLAYSYKSIHVFWNTQKNRLPETLQTQSQLVLPGLQTFAFVRSNSANHLYTIEAGQLYKYGLTQTAASLAIRSDQPLLKTFRLFLYGSCADLQISEEDNIQACKLSKTIELHTTVEEYPREEDLGISATIVGILVIVFLLVIWICLKKYKGLELQARKVLQNYQNKRLRQNRKI